MESSPPRSSCCPPRSCGHPSRFAPSSEPLSVPQRHSAQEGCSSTTRQRNYASRVSWAHLLFATRGRIIVRPQRYKQKQGREAAVHIVVVSGSLFVGLRSSFGDDRCGSFVKCIRCGSEASDSIEGESPAPLSKGKAVVATGRVVEVDQSLRHSQSLSSAVPRLSTADRRGRSCSAPRAKSQLVSAGSALVSVSTASLRSPTSR
ncbi:hypothetical protein; RMQ09562 (plasmid) [Methylorubrum extorquens AM1]|uniref:Uncharacterized protein n=1 Tax=Methylorubrum extorquens (strain ATCC 14718 / DSM 1338 / JCM 2805 / NCIMB 9133 / AM1) TaxID=272630 RepID=C5B589_METEA|nr:hypothetical protein; RMQ09562 [Methylorubrum extorquens AM1]